jgi:hypothetical protein
MIKRQQKTRHEIIQKFHSLRFLLLARFLISNVTRRLHISPASVADGAAAISRQLHYFGR